MAQKEGRPGEGRATRARHKPKKADGGKGNGTRKSKNRRKVASKAYAVSQYLLRRFIRMESWCSDVGQIHTQDGTRTTCLSCIQPRPKGRQVVSGSNRSQPTRLRGAYAPNPRAYGEHTLTTQALRGGNLSQTTRSWGAIAHNPRAHGEQSLTAHAVLYSHH